MRSVRDPPLKNAPPPSVCAHVHPSVTVLYVGAFCSLRGLGVAIDRPISGGDMTRDAEDLVRGRMIDWPSFLFQERERLYHGRRDARAR